MIKRRRRFAQQLQLIMGRKPTPQERRRQSRAHFVRTRCDKLFFLMFDHLPPEEIVDRFEVVNRHLLDEALAKGRGVYVALSHTGAHHVVGLLMVKLGFKVAGVRAANEGAIRRFVQDKLARKNKNQVRYFYSDTYPRAIYRCFADNFVVGSAIDVHRVRQKHLRTATVNIFGEKREFLTGPMQIAIRCGAPVLQGFVISRAGFRYALELCGPLVDPAAGEQAESTVADAVRKYAANVEQFVRQRPCHVSRV